MNETTMTTNPIDIDKISSSVRMILNSTIMKSVSEKPDTRILNLDELDNETLKAYFQTLNTQEWGRRSIVDDELMETAATWFKNELDRLYSFVVRNSVV